MSLRPRLQVLLDVCRPYAVVGDARLLGTHSRSLLGTQHLFVKTGVKAFAEAKRQLEDPFIGREDQDVTCRVENRRADLAVLKVLLHLFKL
jgi:hypothetical protein